MKRTVKTAVIGGSGIYSVPGLTILEERRIRTPFGNPSDTIVIGAFDNTPPIAFLPRHGRGHRLLPSEVNSRANIWALKSLGVEQIVALSAVGSLKLDIKPRDLVVPGQLIDRTRQRPSTFFGQGIVGHVQFGKPFCERLQTFLADRLAERGWTVHRGETYVCMEGPAFSTKAESELYRSWGAGVIGMTALPEAKLAREAEICYGLVAFATDYDCWHEEEVSVEMVLANFHANIEKAEDIVRTIVPNLPDDPSCPCRSAAQGAIMTAKDKIPPAVKRRLDLLYGKYLR